jgi:magnesium transporter
MTEKSPLLPLVEKFFEHDTVAAAHSLERMAEEEAVEVLLSLPASLAARAIRHLQVSYVAALLKDAEPELFREIASALEPQLAATIFMHLPQDTRERLLEHIPGKLKTQIRELLTYPENSVGRIMTTDFLSFHKDVTAHEAVEKIRSLAQKRFPASYAYVIDDEEHLIGVLNMRDLMLASPGQPLEKIMRTKVFTIHGFVDREEAANELSRRRYFAAPIVDSENHIVGIIKAEQLIQGIQEEITEDLQRMFGAGGDERAFSPILFSLKKRLPWLHVNLGTAFLAAAVVAMFEGLIAKLTILAVFLPVVAGQGGNAGAQSLAVVMRGLVMREIPAEKVLGLILKEGRLGVISGAIIGAVTALVAWIWNGNPHLGLVIGLGMLINLVFAGLSGASIPILMKRMGLDPAQCSSIILTTVTDVMGFLAFLGLAVIFQSHLL